MRIFTKCFVCKSRINKNKARKYRHEGEKIHVCEQCTPYAERRAFVPY
ncbi:hypothetical protein GCM10008924_04860 [Gracilibacillus halotolerans]